MYEEFREILTDAITGPKKKYKSVRYAAKAAGISHTSIYHMMKGLDDPTPKLLAALSVAFPERSSELWLAAGHTPPLTDDVDAPEVVHRLEKVAEFRGLSLTEVVKVLVSEEMQRRGILA